MTSYMVCTEMMSGHSSAAQRTTQAPSTASDVLDDHFCIDGAIGDVIMQPLLFAKVVEGYSRTVFGNTMPSQKEQSALIIGPELTEIDRLADLAPIEVILCPGRVHTSNLERSGTMINCSTQRTLKLALRRGPVWPAECPWRHRTHTRQLFYSPHGPARWAGHCRPSVLDHLPRRVKAVYPEPSRLPLQGACGIFIEACRMFHRGRNLRADEYSSRLFPTRAMPMAG